MATLSKFALLGTCALALGLLAFSGSSDRPADASSRAANGEQPGAAANDEAQPAGQQEEPATGQPAPAVKQPPSLVDLSRAAEQKIRTALQTKIDMKLTKTPLREFVEFVAEKGAIPIWINELALQYEGITMDEQLTDELSDATIEQALNWTLRPLGLTWVIEDEVLKVTTEIDAEERLFTRTYNVRSLLRLTDAETGSCPDAPTFGGGAHGYMEPGAFGFCGEWIIELIQQETSGPWMQVDGTGGTISGMGDTMTVRQTWKMQQEVDRLLAVLRVFAAETTNGEILAARPETYPSDEDRQIQAALTAKSSVKYADTPLSSVAADLAQHHKIRVRVSWYALQEEGIADDEPITLTLNDIALGSILHMILEPLGLTYYVSDGTLWITTQIEAEEILYTAVYDVRDLVGPDYDYESLIEMIQQETSGPWMEVDGTGGTISEADAVGALAIRQTHQVHGEIAQLLADLRATIAGQPKVERPPPDPDALVTRIYRLSSTTPAADVLTAIPRFVSPTSWGDEGDGAAIQKVGEAVVIRQTRKVHEQIERFLWKFGYSLTAPSMPLRIEED